MDDNELLTADDIYAAARPVLDQADELSRLLVLVALRVAQGGVHLAERRIELAAIECQLIDEGDSNGKRLSVAEATRRATVALDGAADRAQAHLDGLRALHEALAQRLAVLRHNNVG